MNRTSLLAVTACALVAGVVPLDAEGASPGCQLRVGAILASDAGQSEKELEPIKQQWGNLFRYRSYKMVKDEMKVVKWRTRTGFDIPGGRYLVVSPRGMRDDRILLKILLIEGSRPLVDTVLALKNEGAVVVGGQKHEEGVLLLSIGARTETEGPWRTWLVDSGGN